MSFSWRLLLAPREVAETVVWHEVCHIDVPDHSPRFWALMDARRPEHRHHHRWLSAHGVELLMFNRTLSG